MCNNNFNKNKFHLVKILAMAGMVVLFVGVAGAVVMLLWNAIIPDVTGWKPLTFWQAVGILILFKILFGGLGRRSARHQRHRSRWREMRSKWKAMNPNEREQMKEKWINMDAEEKRAFKQKWKNYCKGKD